MNTSTDLHETDSTKSQKQVTHDLADKRKALKLLQDGNVRYSGFVSRVAEGAGCTYAHLNNCIRGFRDISPILARRVIKYIEQNRVVFVEAHATHGGKIYDKRFLTGDERIEYRQRLEEERKKKVLQKNG